MRDEETSPGQTTASDLVTLRDRMRSFTAERDWSGFHDPKSVLLALVGEVGELAELFQWLPAADAAKLGAAEPLHTRAGEEMSDVLLYLVLLADVLNIDLAAAANAKLTQAALRYPAPAAPTGPATGLADRG
jgi:NTP pyrophosphatase (non-canonical NTP hydrolase)